MTFLCNKSCTVFVNNFDSQLTIADHKIHICQYLITAIHFFAISTSLNSPPHPFIAPSNDPKSIIFLLPELLPLVL